MKYFARDRQIIELAKDKTVLHLGCVGFVGRDPAERVRLAKESLHYALTEVANVTGIDYSEDVIAALVREGLFDNVIAGNVEEIQSLALPKSYELVVAGDIIEHVSNPGRMLDGIRSICDRETRLVVTTPNAFGLPSYLRFLLGRFVEGNEHVMSFNSQNLSNLLERHGFEVVSSDTCYQKNAKRNVLFHFAKAVIGWFPKVGGTLFVVAKVGEDS